MNKKIILSLIVCGFAAFQASAQTTGNRTEKPVQQSTVGAGVTGKTPEAVKSRGNVTVQSPDNTQQPAVQGKATRPVTTGTTTNADANAPGVFRTTGTPATGTKTKKASPNN